MTCRRGGGGGSLSHNLQNSRTGGGSMTQMLSLHDLQEREEGGQHDS